ncbi:unnamed protein product [Adineta ricciae]|uniref:DUF4371 domain-containing protein n=1 Tax=Adineta ricciae TaxID=249248 RepID=A0A815VUI3_ADIRI|nr:unnamed protein product [Adineta ricciae]
MLQVNLTRSNRGNFLEILKWAAQTDPVVQLIFQDSTSNATYLSDDIQNELIHIMSNQIREDIAFMLTNCNYALMADECRDISDEFDAEVLANKIVDFLKSFNISSDSCICLCFDGASVMFGRHAGVHVLLRKYMPKGIYIHCSARRLNLVVIDTFSVVRYMSAYFSIVSNIYSFFTESGVTNMYFKIAQQELDLGSYSILFIKRGLFSFIVILAKSFKLKFWSLTRWDSRWGSTDAIINNSAAVIKALVDISEEDGDSRSVNAGGLLKHVKKSIFIITSFILHQLFGIIKILSDQLKNYLHSEYFIKSIIRQIKDHRPEQSFQQVYDKAKEFCSKNEIEFVHQYQSYRTKVSARFEEIIIDSAVGQREVLSASTDFMNRIIFPLIDCVLFELNDRFSSKT